MPVTWSVVDNGRILFVTMSGRVTDQEYLGAHDGFFPATASAPGDALALIDFSAVTDIQITTAAVRESVRRTTAFLRNAPEGHHRMAIVAGSPAVYGMCRMWQILIEESGLESVLFDNTAEAKEWLNAGKTTTPLPP